MRDVVAVDDVVVPVALARLESRVLELKLALPSAGFGGMLVLGEGQLADVIVPGSQKMHRLDSRGDAERERELN